MDYYFSNYRGFFAFDTKDYLGLYRSGNYFVIYDYKEKAKMIKEIERLINQNEDIDMYAYAVLLYNEGSKANLEKAYNILNKLVTNKFIPANYWLANMYLNGELDINSLITVLVFPDLISK